MSEIFLRSPRDGSLLLFSVMGRTEFEIDFEVRVQTNTSSGQTMASTHFAGSPSLLFRDMANDWRGWSGEKKWTDLENRASFTATADSTGHINLQVELRDSVNYDDRLRVVLEFHAGQLESMAADVEELLG